MEEDAPDQESDTVVICNISDTGYLDDQLADASSTDLIKVISDTVDLADEDQVASAPSSHLIKVRNLVTDN